MAKAQYSSEEVRKEEEKIFFHPKQVEYLEKVFPELVPLPTTTEAEMRHRGGARAVLQFMRGRLRT